MHWKTIEYAAECVLVPVAWGLVVFWISNRIEKKLLKKRKAAAPENSDDPGPILPLDYYI
jgi:hypothetical protein